MRVVVLGLRGFPDVMGGVETHCQNLYPVLARMGCRITVVTRSAYATRREWQGIRFRPLWAPRSRNLEAIVHTLLGTVYAAFTRPDILHIHAIGPTLLTPVARLLGLRVVVTHHGEDYQRQKWGALARLMLRLGERWGMRYSNDRIVISPVLRQLVWNNHQRTSWYIPNGVRTPDPDCSADGLAGFGLEPNFYVLLVSRLVPEKRHQDLIQAFARAKLPGWKLAIVGGSDHPDDYARQVLEAGASTPGVVCTGFQTGSVLRDLYANAGLFVLPSSHEGHPIAVLEAMSYGLRVLLSDIPAHLALALAGERYFPLGDIAALAARLEQATATPADEQERVAIRQGVRDRYDWTVIAQETRQVYQSVLAPRAAIGSLAP